MLPVVAGRAATTRADPHLQRCFWCRFQCCRGRSGLPVDLRRGRRRLWRDLRCACGSSATEAAGPIGDAAHRLFAFSIFYLFVLFAALLLSGTNRSISQTFSARATTAVRTNASCCCPGEPSSATRVSSPGQSRRGLRCGTCILAVVLDRRRDARRLHRRRPRSERTDRRRRTANPVQLARHHAGDRDPDDPRHAVASPIWFRSSNDARPLPAGFQLFRPARDTGLVDPRHDGAVGRRRRLGRRT